ncbi:MAG: DUF3570 domain-containing protein [Myxococcales bacterium]|nr:DUF3570 domain-containing protein [Myxococcales bacterium]
MRLQLVFLLTGVLLPTSVAHAQEVQEVRSAEARLRIYADDDNVTVVSPGVSVRFAASESVEIAAGATVDAVSAASVDVITSASPSTVKELRVEGSASATWAVSADWKLRAGGIVSHESDYLSLRPSIGGQVEAAQRNTILDLAYTAVIDRAGHALLDEFARKRHGHIVAGSVTQVLDRSSYLDLLIDARRLGGYHASPYRLVQWRSLQSPEIALIEESTPAIRQSGAAMLRLRRAFGTEASWFVHGSYRLYLDSWDISSHTLSARVYHPVLEERILLGAHLRGYLQSAADFYRGYYEAAGGESPPDFRTGDRTLGAMQSLHGSFTVDSAIGANRLRTSMSLTQFQFDDFPAQRERMALTLEFSFLRAW